MRPPHGRSRLRRRTNGGSHPRADSAAGPTQRWKRAIAVISCAVAGMFLGAMTGSAVMVINEMAAMVTIIAGMWLGLSFGIWFGFWVSKPR